MPYWRYVLALLISIAHGPMRQWNPREAEQTSETELVADNNSPALAADCLIACQRCGMLPFNDCAAILWSIH